MKKEQKHKRKKYLALVLVCALLLSGIPKLHLIVQAEIDAREEAQDQQEDGKAEAEQGDNGAEQGMERQEEAEIAQNAEEAGEVQNAEETQNVEEAEDAQDVEELEGTAAAEYGEESEAAGSMDVLEGSETAQGMESDEGKKEDLYAEAEEEKPQVVENTEINHAQNGNLAGQNADADQPQDGEDVPEAEKSTPVIEVTYDPVSTSTAEEYREFYKARKAVVSVKNWTAEGDEFDGIVHYDIKASSTRIDVLGLTSGLVWVTEMQPDGSAVYKTEIAFPAESAYVFGMKLDGNNKNNAAEYEPATFMVDAASPVFGEEGIMCSPTNHMETKLPYHDSDGRVWYSQDVAFSFKVQDNGSGLKSVVFGKGSDEYKDFKGYEDKSYDLNTYLENGINYGKCGETQEQDFRAEETGSTDGDGLYQLVVKASDYAGNEREAQSDVIGIDKTAPTIKAESDVDGWVNDRAVFTFTPSDSGSGIAHVYCAKGRTKSDENKIEVKEENGEYVKEFTKTGGDYVCWAIDHVGNESAAVPFQVKVDSEAPEIVGIIFAGVGYSDSEGWKESINVTETSYGYYFREKTELRVRVCDDVSGVKSVSYQLQELGEAKGDAVELTELETDEDGVLFASFVIPANFKGQVYVSATDNAQNTCASVSPEGVIVENMEKHEKHASVAIKLPDLPNGMKAYSADLEDIAVTVEDNYTGLRRVEAEFICNGVSEKETIEIGNDGKLSGDSNGWTSLGADNASAIGDNLITKLEKKFSFKGEGNDIKLIVTLTDRAGFQTSAEKTFSIDKSEPIIFVEYKPIKSQTDTIPVFYNGGCRATITVADRNFDKDMSKNVVFDIKSAVADRAPDIAELEWEEVKEDTKTIPTYRTEILFDQDSHYSLGMTVSDMAGYSKVYGGYVFAVDKTAPVLGDFEIHATDAEKMKKYQEEKESKDTIYWYNQDITLSFMAQDVISGLAAVKTSPMEGADGSFQNLVDAQYGLKEYAVGEGNEKTDFGKRGEVGEKRYEGIKTDGNGIYQLSVNVLDYAGNGASMDSKVIGIDKTAPKITDFTFKPSNRDQVVEWESPDKEEKGYGYYFSGKATVTVTASDEGKTPGSGVATITYCMKEKGETEWKETTIKVKADNKISFETPENFKGQIYFYATDNVGNSGKEQNLKRQTNGVIAETETMHRKSSEIEINLPDTDCYDAEGHNLYESEISVPIIVADSYSGLSKVEWSVTSVYQDSENNQEGTVIIGNNADDADALSKDAEGWEIAEKDNNLAVKMEKKITVRNNSNDIKLTVTITDRAGHSTTETKVFSIDKTKPDISVEYNNEESPVTSMDKNYKAFYKNERQAKITIRERNFDKKEADMLVEKAIKGAKEAIISGWKDEDGLGGRSDDAAHTCTVTYPGNGAYRFSMEVKDLAGNRAHYHRDGSADIFIVDKDKPTLRKDNLMVEPISSDTVNTYTDGQGVQWYNQNVRFLFKAKDGCAGLYHVTSNAYAMDGLTGQFKKDIDKIYKLQDYAVGEKDYGKRGEVEEEEYTVSSDTENNASQKYRLMVNAVDYAGNENSMSSDIIGIDREKPRIIGIAFEGVGNQDSAWRDRTTVSKEDYGYYFRGAATVKITATDVNEKGFSGVKSISYRLADIRDDGEREFITPKLQANENEAFISFDVPEGFKGQIYAYATDNVGNEGAMEQPDGTVRENEAQKSEARIEVTSPETAIQDEGGRPLYASDTTFHLMAEDIHAGIGKVEWSIESAEDSGNNQSGTLVVNPDGTLSETSWQIIKTDENLVTRLERDITVHNNSNNIRLKVTLTDRAGNVTEYNNGEGVVFSIDKTQPQIEVVYLQNDASNDKYYNKDRTAVITVTERNFDEEATNMQIQITNTDRAIPAYGTWTHGGETGTDRATHTCQITYAADGDYTFTMGTVDKAKNSAVYGKTDEFTIDQTKPEVSVSYSTDGLSNDIYYKSECVATITVTEHNFNDAGMVITQTAELDGRSIPVPSGIRWSSSGDVHTATINYDTDGDYTLSVSGQDMALNELEAYTGTKFVVDRTEPEIEITDVDDMTAYNGTVAPGIAFNDINCDADSVKIVLKGYEHEAQDLTGSLSRSAHGGSIRLPDFNHTADVDDVYTLTARVSDMAGNSKEVSKVFSVNRYGSNYILGDDTQKLVNDYYANQEEDLVIREINVSSLQTEGITYSRDGEMVTLKEEEDYDVQEDGTEFASWKEYTYTVHAHNFEEEGAYTVTVLSTDTAKNSMSNRTAKIKEYTKEVAFVIDKTAPTIVATGVENNRQYMENEREIKVDSQDNVAIDFVEVYLNDSGTPVQTWMKEELAENNGIMNYMLKAASNWQSLRFVAVDKAGNRKESDILRCLLTTNVWIQFINNRVALYGTFLLVALAGGACYFIFAKRRKKNQEKGADAQ